MGQGGLRMEQDAGRKPEASESELVSLDDAEIEVNVAPQESRLRVNAATDSSWKASGQNQQNYQNN